MVSAIYVSVSWKNVANSVTDDEPKKLAIQNYNELEKEVKRKARADKRKWANDLANQAQSAAESNNMRETYSLARRNSCKQPEANKRYNRPIEAYSPRTQSRVKYGAIILRNFSKNHL